MSSHNLHHAHRCIPGSSWEIWVSESLGGRTAFGGTCSSCSLARSSKEARKKGRISGMKKIVRPSDQSVQTCSTKTPLSSFASFTSIDQVAPLSETDIQNIHIFISSRSHTFFYILLHCVYFFVWPWGRALFGELGWNSVHSVGRGTRSLQGQKEESKVKSTAGKTSWIAHLLLTESEWIAADSQHWTLWSLPSLIVSLFFAIPCRICWQFMTWTWFQWFYVFASSDATTFALFSFLSARLESFSAVSAAISLFCFFCCFRFCVSGRVRVLKKPGWWSEHSRPGKKCRVGASGTSSHTHTHEVVHEIIPQEPGSIRKHLYWLLLQLIPAASQLLPCVILFRGVQVQM